MNRSIIIPCVLFMGAVALSVGTARADVFNMPAGETSLATVAVGDAGNAAEPATGRGAVSYSYQISKYDVTAAQYCQFLNAKGATDPYGLWNSNMSTDSSGGIDRSGTDGSYTYAVKTGHDNNPAIYITWYDALRFANWLSNGQGSGSTESGPYTLTGTGPTWTVSTPSASQRATWANSFGKHWVLTSVNELYKSLYYKGGGTSAGYWHYGNRSDTAPASEAPSGSANAANVYSGSTGFAFTHSFSQDPSFNYLTDVGAYYNCSGPYGTFDQEGPVTQWSDYYYSDRALAYGGGWWYSGNYFMGYNAGAAVLRSNDTTLPYMGFRVACIGLGSMPGDANNDGKVDIADLAIVLTNFDHSGMAWSQGDFDHSGTVDIADLSSLLTNFDKTFAASPGLAAVPEPSTVALLVAALLAPAAYAKSRRRGNWLLP
jgi:formylglycine-generating enzyme